MESQGRGKRTADQLQSAPVQDQAVQSSSAQEASPRECEGMTPPAPRLCLAPLGKGGDPVRLQTIKGYLDSPVWSTVEELLSHAPHSSPESFRVRDAESI